MFIIVINSFAFLLNFASFAGVNGFFFRIRTLLVKWVFGTMLHANA